MWGETNDLLLVSTLLGYYKEPNVIIKRLYEAKILYISKKHLCINIYVLFYVLFVLIVLFYVLFVCKCVLYYCHRVATKLQ
jgi:hypothetical protein